MSREAKKDVKECSGRNSRKKIAYVLISAGVMVVVVTISLLLLNRSGSPAGSELPGNVEYNHPGKTIFL